MRTKISFMAAKKRQTISELFYNAILKTIEQQEEAGILRDMTYEDAKFLVQKQFVYMSLKDFIEFFMN